MYVDNSAFCTCVNAYCYLHRNTKATHIIHHKCQFSHSLEPQIHFNIFKYLRLLIETNAV